MTENSICLVVIIQLLHSLSKYMQWLNPFLAVEQVERSTWKILINFICNNRSSKLHTDYIDPLHHCYHYVTSCLSIFLISNCGLTWHVFHQRMLFITTFGIPKFILIASLELRGNLVPRNCITLIQRSGQRTLWKNPVSGLIVPAWGFRTKWRLLIISMHATGPTPQ